MSKYSFSNFELVTIAVALLGGNTKYIDPEDIAIKANEIAPGKFNWRKYSDRIDLGLVKIALRDAKKKKNGQLLIGNNKNGWMLSPDGVTFFDDVDVSDLLLVHPPSHRKDSIAANIEAERLRLRNTKAYQLFVEGDIENITLEDFYQFARINEYFKEKSRKRRYTIVSNAVEDEKTLSKLWKYLANRFPEEFE